MNYRVLIAVGANLGDRIATIEKAYDLINQRCGKITAKASYLKTSPIGAADQEFVNSAIICETKLSPQTLLDKLLEIERDLGRVRKVHWGNRTIDLDIILVRDQAGQNWRCNTEQLTVPHPHFRERGFVLDPAREIAADWLI